MGCEMGLQLRESGGNRGRERAKMGTKCRTLTPNPKPQHGLGFRTSGFQGATWGPKLN